MPNLLEADLQARRAAKPGPAERDDRVTVTYDAHLAFVVSLWRDNMKAIAGGRSRHDTNLGRLRGAVHAEAKKRGLSEEDRRALMARLIGKDSTTRMTASELGEVLDALKGRRATSGRPMASRAHHKKIRALWLSLYHLGAVLDPSEAALGVFARRQCGVDALAWVDAEAAVAVIEALKGWSTREGVDWSASRNPRVSVIAAQRRRLIALGRPQPESCPGTDDEIIRRLGEEIRELMEARKRKEAQER